MLDGKGVALSLSNSPTLVSASLGSTTGTLELSEVVTYTANYVLTQQTVDSGLVSNSMVVIGSTYGFQIMYQTHQMMEMILMETQWMTLMF